MIGPRGILLVTDRWQAHRPLDEVVRAAVDGGARWVLLRERDLPRPERLELARRLRAILAPVQGTLLVAGPDPLDGDAVHLPAAGPYPPPALPLVGRSCHDPSELGRVSTEHYVTLSPVYPSPSKPGYGPPLGPDGLAGMVVRSPVPVVALGGVSTPEQVAACLAAGAVGVAVMGAVMRSGDPAGLVRDLSTAADARTDAVEVRAGVVDARAGVVGVRADAVEVRAGVVDVRAGAVDVRADGRALPASSGWAR